MAVSPLSFKRRLLYGILLGMPCLSIMVLLGQIRGLDSITLMIGLYLYPVLGVIGLMMGYRTGIMDIRGRDTSLLAVTGIRQVLEIVNGHRITVETPDSVKDMREASFIDGNVSGAVQKDGEKYWQSVPLEAVTRIERSGMSLVDRGRARWE